MPLLPWVSAAPLSRGLKEQLHCCVKFTVLLRRHDCGNSGEKQEKNVQIESQIVLHQYLIKPCQKTTMNSWDFGHFRVWCSHWYLSSLSSPDVFDFTDDPTAHKQRKRETTMWRKLYSQTWCNPMPVKLKTSHYHLSGRPTKNLRMKRQRRHVTFTRLSRWQKKQKQKHNSFSFLTSAVTLLSRSVPVPIRHFCEPKPCVLKKDPSPSCHALQQHKSSHSRGIVNTVNHDSVVFIFLYKINICCLYNYLLSYFTIMRGKKENSTERTILYSYI